MLKIIVVDDETEEHTRVRKIIKPLLFKYEELTDPILFDGYNDELKSIIKDTSERKIYLLDINLGTKITGLNIASLIREEDWNSEIIFLTNHDNYFEKVYRNIFKVFDFIEKFDNLPDRLTEDLELILNKDYDNAMFTFKNNQVNLKLFLKDILYISRDTVERKLIIKTTHNAFKINKTLEEMLTELDERFEQVHRSCIVNTARVSKYNWSTGDFILDTSEKVPLLSKKYKEKVVK